MANIKLDFSKMKHVSSDKDSTTLQHPAGHKITLKHSALSPDNKVALMALSGIAKNSETPAEQDKMKHKTELMATGGPVDELGGTGSPSNPVSRPDKGFGAIIVKEAEGGEAKKEDVLDYKQIKKDYIKKNTNVQPGSTLDYNQIRQEKKEINRKQMAEGGDPSDEKCQTCGSPIRKAYANPNAQVSQNDSAPQVPTNLDPNSAGAPAVVPNYHDPNQATKEPLLKQDSDTARTKEIYNQMVSNVIPKGMTAPITAAQFGKDGQPPQQFDAQNWVKAQKEETDEKAQNAAAISEQQQKTIQENQARVSAGLAPLPVPDVPNGPQIPGTPENPPQPNAINPSGQPVDSMDSGMQSVATMMQQGFMNQMSGISGTADAQARQADMQAKALDFNAKAEQGLLSTYQKNSDAINGEMDAVRNDIANSHITPDKYWTGDKDGNGGHSKIAAGIGMILAGFNPTNKPNAAIDFLNKQMEMNLHAQVQEMNKKQNVLTSLNSKFRNMNDTMTFARMVNNQMLQSQLASAAAKAIGGPNGLAHSAAQQAIGQLQQQYAPLQQKLQMSQTMMHIANDQSADPDMQVAQATKLARYMTAMGDPAQAKQWQDATVPGVGVTRNLAPVPEAVRAQIVAHKSMNDTMNQALELAKQPIPTNPSDYVKYVARANTLQGQLIGLVKQAQHDGVYKPSEADFLTSQLGGSPGSIFRDLSAIPKIQELQDVKQNEYNNLLQTNNLSVRQLPRTQMQQSQPQTKTVNGVTYKRGPNGEAIRVN